MNKLSAAALIILASTLTAACSRQSTPSMMNTSKPRVAHETTMEQRLVSDVSKGYLFAVAQNYERYGTDKLNLTLAYDPQDKGYDAMRAFKDLARFKEHLGEFGVSSVTGETVRADGAEPTLMVSYDSARALAPAGCRNMPGFDDGMSTAEIGGYRFGCSVDSMIASQIYRPTDLYGRGDSDIGDGRRAANTVEYYRRVDQVEAESELNRIQRSDIQSE